MARFALNYIDDAATARVTLVSPAGRVYTNVSNYDPLDGWGVHLCGHTDDGEQPTTVANYPMGKGAPRLWQLARDVAECGKDEADFIVDLVTPGGIVDDFWSNRQLWPRAIEAWNSAPPTPGT